MGLVELYSSKAFCMVKKDKYIKLVKQAQLGDKDALERLAEVARECLRVHVYRLVLADAATEDIVQECMIVMFQILHKLKRRDRFWAWLYGIAHNKILHYHRAEGRQNSKVIIEARNSLSFHGGETDEKQEVCSFSALDLRALAAPVISSTVSPFILRATAKDPI